MSKLPAPGYLSMLKYFVVQDKAGLNPHQYWPQNFADPDI